MAVPSFDRTVRAVWVAATEAVGMSHVLPRDGGGLADEGDELRLRDGAGRRDADGAVGGAGARREQAVRVVHAGAAREAEGGVAAVDRDVREERPVGGRRRGGLW